MKEIINYEGFEIEILLDEEPMDPREWCNLGTMACFHNRYNLGDEQDILDHNDFDSFLEMGAFLEKNDYIYLPIFMYDHSGLRINTTGFSCSWDSGQIGYIFISKEKVREEFNCKNITQKIRKKVLNNLKLEIETYDHYLTGNVYGYNIEELGESCWGFFGDTDYCIQEAKDIIDHHIKITPKQLQLEFPSN